MNVTVIVSLPPAATVAEVGATVNCDASVPPTVIPDTVRSPVPVLLIVNVFWDEEPTSVPSIASDVTDTPAAGTPTPVPLRVTADGLPDALCAIDSEAAFAPTDVGVNVTVIVSLPPDATVAATGDTVNCDASVPPTVIPDTVRSPVPVLSIVNVFWDEDPTLVASIVSDDTDMPATGTPTPVPLRVSADGLPAASCAIDRDAVLGPSDVGKNVTVTAWL